MHPIVFLLAYLLGNLTSAYVLGRLFFGVDIRSKGSGNAGATNALRTFGVKFGVLTLILDLLKGFLAVVLAGKLVGESAVAAAALGVVLGHNWPILFGFRGGKGMSTSGGVALYIDYRLFLALLVVFVLVILITRYVSLGSVSIAIGAPVLAFVLDYQTRPWVFYVFLILGTVAVYKHRTNLERLFKGEEHRVSLNRGAKS